MAINYYSHHIGDFDRATRHLSRVERSVYRDMIDIYYDTESPLTSDLAALCRKIVARTEEEKSAVLAVLDEFFLETPNGWFHDRCEEELDAYRKSKSQASAAGKASAAARAERRVAALNGNDRSTTVQRPFNDRSTEVKRTVNEPSTNQEPITNNQEPETKKVKPDAPPDGEAMIIRIDVEAVFSYWQLARGHERAKLDDKRTKAIRARLKDGYSIEDLCRAVDGIARSAHHMGQNDQRTVYDDIELICRSAANVDKFAKLAGPAPALDAGLQRQVDILQQWMEQE